MEKPTFKDEQDKMEWFAERFSYDPETGTFEKLDKYTYIRSPDDRRLQLYVYGYDGCKTWIKAVYAHRLAYWLVHGKLPKYIDHINGDGKDNRPCNMRPATIRQNNCNRTKQSNNSCGFKGVNWHKETGRWRARITLHGKSNSLGLFDTPEEAHKAYCVAANQLHGEFARG